LGYRVRKVDANQPDIVATFRALGCEVWITSEIGRGAPDLVIRKGAEVRLIEVKNGFKPPSARKLTPDEEEFKDKWEPVYAVIETQEQAHQLVADMMISTALRQSKGSCSGCSCRSGCGG
jgi:hypothetical protein